MICTKAGTHSAKPDDPSYFISISVSSERVIKGVRLTEKGWGQEHLINIINSVLENSAESLRYRNQILSLSLRHQTTLYVFTHNHNICDFLWILKSGDPGNKPFLLFEEMHLIVVNAVRLLCCVP